MPRKSSRSKEEPTATREEILHYLTRVIRTPAGTVDETDPLCQSFKTTSTSQEVRVPCKLKAIERLAKMMGWDAPEKHTIKADGLLELLESVRGNSLK